MPVHLGKQDSDINAWPHNDFHKTLLGHGEWFEVEKNGDNPPTVKQYSRFQFYDTYASYTIPASPSTGNNVYPNSDTPTFLNAHAIYEDGADQTFAWSSGDFPAKSDGTWYLYCSGGEDTDKTSKGKGIYGASKTETPTLSIQKGGYYSASGYRVLAKFTVSGGTVSATIETYNEYIYKDTNDDVYIKNNTQDKDIIFRVNDGGVTTVIMTMDGSEGKIAVGSLAAEGKLDIQDGGITLLLGADSGTTTRTNSTAKYSRIGCYHYINAEEPAAIIYGYSDTGHNVVNIGGGTSALNAATELKFHTAANTTTTVGTLRMTIDSLGDTVIPDSGTGKLCIGTGKDGQIYSSSDNLYIENITQDKDIIFRVNDGGVTTVIMTMDGSASKIGMFTSTPDAPVDISASNISLLLGADENSLTRTNATQKLARIGGYHYTNSEQPVSLLVCNSSSADSTINFGGGTSVLNAATTLRFYTAANTTTTGGTEQMRITANGGIYLYNLLQQSAAGLVMEYDTSSKGIYAENCSIKTKTNIRNLKEAESEYIYQLKEKKYDSVVGKKQKNRIGYIAEDIEKIAPHLVCYDENGDITGYNQLGLLYTAIAEIKKLNKRIKKLEKK